MIFFLVSVIKTDILIGRMKAIENEKYKLQSSLTSATSDAINYLSRTGSYGSGSINKDEVLNKFFTSLYTSLGIISDFSAQEEIEIYIPVILLCDVDGYYVYYYDEYKGTDGNTYIERVWSEKMPYSYEDECFIYRFTLSDMVYIYDKNNILDNADNVIYIDYKEFQSNSIYSDFKNNYKKCILLNEENFNLVRKGIILNTLENAMAYYTSRHNIIAATQGITYNFSFPKDKQDEWAQYIEDVNLLVVFQGYPYGPLRDYTYNKIASAGANVVKRPKYLLEERSWYLLAHKQGCEKITESTRLRDETFDSLEECVRLGAYSCEWCIEYGARVPEID